MKRRLFPVLGLLSIALLLVSCAKNEEPSDTDLYYQSFDAWMSLYAPQAQKQETGIYTEVMVASTQVNAKTPSANDLQWVKINYTARTLRGDVFLSRDSTIAKWEKTFAKYIHYAPDYLWHFRNESESTSNIYPIAGVYDALKLMKEGDKWKVYIPAPLAYGDTGYSVSGINYQGCSSVAARMPVVVDLELVKVIEDPEVYELSLVQNYALTELGVSISDSIAEGIYYKSLGFMPNAGEEPEKLVSASYFKYRYVGRFIKEDFQKPPYLDPALERPPFVFDTNIKDSADLYDLSQYKTKIFYEAPVSASLGGESFAVKAWDSVLLNKMHYGEYGRLVTTSSFAYGEEGEFTSGSTYIPPYTPLVFDVWVSSYNGEGTYEFPYSIAKVLDNKTDMDDVWFVGSVYGVITGDDMMTSAELGNIPRTEVRTNILIADNTSLTDASIYIPIELPAGLLRDSLNYPDNYRKFTSTKLKIKGDIRDYYGVKGIRNVTEYKIY